MKKLILILSLAAVLFCGVIKTIPAAAASATAMTSAKAAVVMEVSSGRVLYSQNSKQPLPIASTTKILTALVVLENCDINSVVTVPEKAVGVEGSSIYLAEGEKLTVRELLYGLMLRSGNDAATALALHCCDTVEHFADLMNETAAGLGCENYSFANPHGLHDDDHYCSAMDLAKISAAAMRNEDFKEISSTKTVKISNETKDYPRVLYNKNKLFNLMTNATGIKTGFTKKAGRCFVGSSNQDGLELVTVLISCGPMFEDCKRMLEHFNALYEFRNLTEKIEIPSTLFVEDGKAAAVEIKLQNSFSYPLKKDGSEDAGIEVRLQMVEKAEAPVKKGDKMGLLEILRNNQLIFSSKIVSITDVEKKGFFDFFSTSAQAVEGNEN